MQGVSVLRRGGALLVTALALIGCGGGPQTDAGDYYLTLELDGTLHAFNVDVSANDPPSEATVHFVTVGGQAADGAYPSFDFQLVSPGVQLGTFDSAHDELHATYVQADTSFQAVGAEDSRFVMTLTRLDHDGVAGTFHGMLREIGGGDNARVLRVTNGRFSARYNYR